MLGKSNYVALIGGGKNPGFAPNKVSRKWEWKTKIVEASS